MAMQAMPRIEFECRRAQCLLQSPQPMTAKAIPFPLSLLFVLPLAGMGCVSPGSELSVENVHTVTTGALIRGAQPDAAGLLALKRAYGIQTVVNLNDTTTQSEAGPAEDLRLTYVPIPSDPFRPNRTKLITFLRIARDAPRTGPVYLHCQAGMDRTGVAVGVYRIVLENWSARDAVSELRKYQTWPHRILFAGIPAYLEAVERDKASWQSELEQFTRQP
jgi:protein tyrosine/serine phosphatase